MRFSEAVLLGHPDKLADIISDAVVDAFITLDPSARVACEVLVAKQDVFVAGEMTSVASPEIQEIVRSAIASVGYDQEGLGFSASECRVHTSTSQQSKNLAEALFANSAAGRLCAGDQAVVVGYAEGNAFGGIPAEVFAAKTIARAVSSLRASDATLGLCPDGKVLVGLQDQGEQWCEIVVVSVQHRPGANAVVIHDAMHDCVEKSLGSLFRSGATRVVVNPPNGTFTFGGPAADTGLTGRKLVVDAYGASVPIGGGAFSGKDPTKVDRTGAYAARWVAKSLVRSELCQKAMVTLTYLIGDEQPIGVNVAGCGRTPDAELRDIVLEAFDLSPTGIIEALNLRRPIFVRATSSAHFGLDGDLPWETSRQIPFQ